MSKPDPGTLTLPAKLASVKFAVIGDSGRGTPPQYEVAAQMVRFRQSFPFAFVLMLGDNIYEGPATPEDYRLKFEEPYRALLDDGVKFYAVLGNHDDPRQVLPLRSTWTASATTASRLPWIYLEARHARRILRARLDQSRSASSCDGSTSAAKSNAEWKIVFLHHPLYTSGRYRAVGASPSLGLEPLLITAA